MRERRVLTAGSQLKITHISLARDADKPSVAANALAL
jgi:hypothetical protein